jgi:hypothetical protein
VLRILGLSPSDLGPSHGCLPGNFSYTMRSDGKAVILGSGSGAGC